MCGNNVDHGNEEDGVKEKYIFSMFLCVFQVKREVEELMQQLDEPVDQVPLLPTNKSLQALRENAGSLGERVIYLLYSGEVLHLWHRNGRHVK